MSGQRRPPFSAGAEASEMGKRGAEASHAVRRRRKALGEALDVLLSGRETRDRIVLELEQIAPLKTIASGDDKGTVYIKRDAVLLGRLYAIATMDCKGDPRMLQHSIRATELLVDAALGRDHELDEMERAGAEAEDEALACGVVLMPPIIEQERVTAGAVGSGEDDVHE